VGLEALAKALHPFHDLQRRSAPGEHADAAVPLACQVVDGQPGPAADLVQHQRDAGLGLKDTVHDHEGPRRAGKGPQLLAILPAGKDDHAPHVVVGKGA
jgi:hypothetical protein